MNDPSVVAPHPASAVASPIAAARWRERALRSLVARFDRLALRGRFRLLVIAFAVPFLGGIVWSDVRLAAIERQRLTDQVRADATLLAARFGDHIEQVDRLLGTAAHAIGTNIDDVAAIDGSLQNLRSFVPKTVDNIGVWGSDGHNISALDRRSMTRNVNVADRKYFADAVARRDLSFEGPTISRSTGATIIQFAHPVIGPRNDVVGVITISMRPNELMTLLDSSGTITDKALVTVLNEQGRIVARSIDPALWTGQQIRGLEALRVAFAGRTGWREEIGLDGQARIAGYAVVGAWPWMVMVGQPVEAVTGPAGFRLLRDLVVGAAVIWLLFVVAGRFAARTARALTRVAGDVDRLAAGDLSHRSAVGGGGEIARLVDGFNGMADVVEAREQALSAGHRQLRAIIDHVPAQIYYIDRDERYVFVNGHRGTMPDRGAVQMIGRTAREVRGDAFYERFGPILQRALAGEASAVDITREHEGRTLHFHNTYQPDRTADGTIVGVHCFSQDITERKRAEIDRIESEKRLLTITDNLPATICYVDETRRFRFANRALERWFERPREQIIGERFDSLMPATLAAHYDYHFLRGLQGEVTEYEIEVPTRNGGKLWLRSNFVPDFDEATGKVKGVYGMSHNITKAKNAEDRLTRLAQFDTLTGIANRNQFNDTLADVLAADERDRQPLALMFLDIDHFKQVNDRCGHAGGDLLLKEFARRLTGCVRPDDTVARLSGDEFVVLLVGMHSDDEPQFIARKIIATVEKPFVLDDRVVRVTTSIGIAMRGAPGEAASVLMKRADDALYEAKGCGRNTFRMAG